jgi:hypothetical protein
VEQAVPAAEGTGNSFPTQPEWHGRSSRCSRGASGYGTDRPKASSQERQRRGSKSRHQQAQQLDARSQPAHSPDKVMETVRKFDFDREVDERGPIEEHPRTGGHCFGAPNQHFSGRKVGE